MRSVLASDRLFYVVFGVLTLLAVAPFWMTQLLPMQDYPHFLVLARAYGDCRDPATPFFGTYTIGFPLSPVLLPILVVRALGAFAGLETGGRLALSLYAAGLPAASLFLLRSLGRDRWAVLLVFPLVISYWVIGGFFVFATSAPLLVFGLALGVRWLAAPSWGRGAAFAAMLCALHLWHALAFAQLMFDFGVLWLLVRAGDLRARALALAPIFPALLLFAGWMLSTVHGRAPGTRPGLWVPFFDNAPAFFTYVGPIIPEGTGAIVILAIIVASGGLARSAPSVATASPAPVDGEPGPMPLFRVANPFAVLAFLAVISFLVFPMTLFGVEGIANRQPYEACLLFVFAWNLPARPAARALVLALVGGASALGLVHLGRRFAAFERETGGASRLINHLKHGDTMLAPIGVGSTISFPGKPLVALDLYASIRHGGLPNASFAGYDIMIIRYVNDRNPMPGIGAAWVDHPQLKRFDYVLLRGPTGVAAARPRVVRPVAKDGEWSLFAVCGSQAMPVCR